MKQKRQVIKFFIPERVAIFILPKVEGYVSPVLLGYSVLIFSSLARTWHWQDFLLVAS